MVSLSGVLGLLRDTGTVFHVLFLSCGWGVERNLCNRNTADWSVSAQLGHLGSYLALD